MHDLHRDVRGAHTRCSSPRSTSTARRRHACAAITQSRRRCGRSRRRRRAQRGRRGAEAAQRLRDDRHVVVGLRPGARSRRSAGTTRQLFCRRAHPPICTQLTPPDGIVSTTGCTIACEPSVACTSTCTSIAPRSVIATHCDEPANASPSVNHHCSTGASAPIEVANAGRARRRSELQRLRCDDPPDVGVHLHRDARLADGLVVRSRSRRATGRARRCPAARAAAAVPSRCGASRRRARRSRTGSSSTSHCDTPRTVVPAAKYQSVLAVFAHGTGSSCGRRSRPRPSTTTSDENGSTTTGPGGSGLAVGAEPAPPVATDTGASDARSNVRTVSCGTVTRAHDRRRRRCRAARSPPRRRRSSRGSTA